MLSLRLHTMHNAHNEHMESVSRRTTNINDVTVYQLRVKHNILTIYNITFMQGPDVHKKKKVSNARSGDAKNSTKGV